MKHLIFYIFLSLGILLIGGIFIFANREDVPQKSRKLSPYSDLNKQFSFANETVPLHLADVRERLDKEIIINTNLHSTTTLVIKRANRVFPIMEPILKKHGIPDDFKYLAVIESGLVNVVSPAGARGVWQFMPNTAIEKGMEVNENVDERYHLEKSTEAACLYLKQSKDKFGSWTLAAAAYNAGNHGVLKQLDFQGVDSYYDLLLTEETSRYVFRILALKEIMSHPESYGFDIPKNELYQRIETKTVVVDSTIHDLPKFAKSLGINYKILKLHNPWIRDKKFENKNGKDYALEIPIEGY